MLEPNIEHNANAGFAVIYRWRIEPSMEAEFVDAWASVTTLLKGRGSLGARLHRGADGIWYSYAQWPDANSRQAAFAKGDVDEKAQSVMRSAILETLPEIVLEPIADLMIGRIPE